MAMPDSARAEYITDIFLHHLFPRHQPRVTILWFSDPDKTYHSLGIGSPESLQAIQAVDTQLGRLLDWSQESSQAGRVNLLALSDHGHVTVRDKVAVNEVVSADVTPAGRGYYAEQVAVVPGLTGEIHVHNHDPKLVSRIAQWMMSQPWCGSVFTRGRNEVEGIVPGTFARSLVGNDHARSGDIVYIMRTDDTKNEHGLRGSCYDDSGLPVGGSTHGGLSPYELQNVLAAVGPDFQSGQTNTLPSGTIDVMPTLLHLMGYPIPPSVDGRVLREALASSRSAEGWLAEPAAYGVAAKEHGYYQYLETARVDKTVYVERGWCEA
jgi:predicted AlkP superfamily pyrophosphatase or phosphodiesterase